MNNMNNKFNNNKDANVRLPDPIKRERLIYGPLDPFKYNENKELNKILKLSKNEFDESQNIREKKDIDNIIEERTNKFLNIKQKINKILSFDKKNTYIYQNILSIIELYIEGFIDHYSTDDKEFNQIFDILKTIRLTKEEFGLLHNLIVTK